LIPRKLRGSLTQLPRLKGYLLIWAIGSGSNGSGAFRFGWSDLNGAVRTVRSARRGSGRSDLVGLAGTAGLHGGARWRVHVTRF
jgi:hypothetical protein